MDNRQFLAQIGVFVLVGLNVAAYYVFWPAWDGGSAEANKGREKLVKSLRVEANEPQRPPVSVPAPPIDFPTPIEPARMPVLMMPAPAVPNAAEKDALGKLLEQIEKDVPRADAPPPLSIPPAPLSIQSPDQRDAPRTLPMLQADPPPTLPPPPASENKKPGQGGLIQTAGLEAKTQHSPWQFKMEIIGTQTQLIAQVKQPAASRGTVEFKILCDRVEMKTPDGALQAVGKITFSGAGLSGSCQRLTLPFNDLRVEFEDDVRITYEPVATSADDRKPAPSGILRGERFLWELTTDSVVMRPVSFSPPTPLSPKVRNESN